MKVNLIQFDINSSTDVKLFAEMFNSIGIKIPALDNAVTHAKINLDEPQKAAMTSVTNQLAKAIGNKPMKLDTKQRAKVAADARWAKKRLANEKKMEKAIQDMDYKEVTDPTFFNPNEQPIAHDFDEETVDGRHIIEG
jgi:hypothetical protein